MDPIISDRFNSILNDGGPLYAEFNPHWIIVEPWNAISSLLIILPALLWIYKLRNDWKGEKFLFILLILLLLGGIGSLIFHAFRSSMIWLMLDVIPSAMMVLLVISFFWLAILSNWRYLILVIVGNIILRVLGFLYLDPHSATNLDYGLTGLSIFLPVLILLKKTNFKRSYSIYIAISALSLSLIFREIDARRSLQFLPMGTHFLWHILSGLGAWYVADYVYYYRKHITKKPAVTGF